MPVLPIRMDAPKAKKEASDGKTVYFGGRYLHNSVRLFCPISLTERIGSVNGIVKIGNPPI
jgi:hypothetical protein